MENETDLLAQGCYPCGSLLLFSSLSLYHTLLTLVPFIFSLCLPPSCTLFAFHQEMMSCLKRCVKCLSSYHRSCLMVAPHTQAPGTITLN